LEGFSFGIICNYILFATEEWTVTNKKYLVIPETIHTPHTVEISAVWRGEKFVSDNSNRPFPL
jgi:hypothetical protein